MARRRDARRVQSGTLITYDGQQMVAWDDVRRSDANTLSYGGGEISIDAVTIVRPGLYFVGADDVTLLSETDFHAARRRVVFSSLFENNSDILEFARQAALWVQLAVTLLTWFAVQSLSGSLASVAQHVATLAGGK